MILSISIISLIAYIVSIAVAWTEEDIESASLAIAFLLVIVFGAILVLSTWYLDTTMGIISLCVSVFFFFGVVFNRTKS